MKKDRVLLSAILFSAVWHLFWLSSLAVVVAPGETRPPKFSNVSFLGPILEQNMLKVSSAAHERIAAEKRYFSEIEDSSVLIRGRAGMDVYAEADLSAGTDIFGSDEEITGLAVSAIDGSKLEPDNSQ